MTDNNVAAQRPGKAIASPAVRRRARELDIDISQVKGSGAKGRVLKQDVEAFAQGTENAAASATVNATAQPTATSSQAVGGKRVEAIRGVKAAMAKQMMRSVSTIPHFTYADEFDLTAVMALQNS